MSNYNNNYHFSQKGNINNYQKPDSTTNTTNSAYKNPLDYNNRNSNFNNIGTMNMDANNNSNKPFSQSLKFNNAKPEPNSIDSLFKSSSLLGGGIMGGSNLGSINGLGGGIGIGGLMGNDYGLANNAPFNSNPSSLNTPLKQKPNININISSNSQSNTPMNQNSRSQVQTPLTRLSNNPMFNPKASNVKEYSYREDQNSKFRQAMEDMCKIVDQFDIGTSFFSLYDGHGGSDPVIYAKDRMPGIFTDSLKQFGNNIEKAFIFAYQKLDDELKFTDSENVGTTACICYLRNESDTVVGVKRILYTGNLGDTRAVVITGNSTKRLSYDHKANDPNEINRIKSVGGMIFNGRVFGQLALSRALGDHALKKYGVSCVPYVSRHVIDFADKYIIIASDGLWDVVNEDELVYLSLNVNNSDDFADLLVKTAMSKGSRDNTSVIVVKL